MFPQQTADGGPVGDLYFAHTTRPWKESVETRVHPHMNGGGIGTFPGACIGRMRSFTVAHLRPIVPEVPMPTQMQNRARGLSRAKR